MPSQILEQREPTKAEALRSVVAGLEAAASIVASTARALALLAAEPEERPVAGPDELLTVVEAARELRRSPAFVRGQCRLGAIKALRDGHGWRVRRSALQAYERRRTA